MPVCRFKSFACKYQRLYAYIMVVFNLVIEIMEKELVFAINKPEESWAKTSGINFTNNQEVLNRFKTEYND